MTDIENHWLKPKEISPTLASKIMIPLKIKLRNVYQ
jgi:hypothetical protein